MTRAILTACLLAAILLTPRAHPQGLEPPPESAEGADYEAEAADTLQQGSIELGVGLEGRSGGGPRKRRRVRVNDGDLRGAVRDGEGDPLSGGSVEARNSKLQFGAGRLAPRWGRGLIIGAPAEPWSTTALDRGSRSAYRGRAGEGAWVRSGEESGLEAICGRFARRDLAGLRAGWRGAGMGVICTRDRAVQSSLWLGRDQTGIELACDRKGRWRAEVGCERSSAKWSIAGHTRAGLSAFRSFAEPQRSGPSRALAIQASRRASNSEFRALAALWRFAPGQDGARCALEWEREVGASAKVALGFEEQHGRRRETAAQPRGFRQGFWGECRGGSEPMTLAVRHEVWGERAWARGSIRDATIARFEAKGPGRSALIVTHAVHRARAGESIYLPEPRTDRLVLRALSGTGQRTRIELRAPAGRGWVHLSLGLSRSRRGVAPAQWTLEWVRRSGGRGRVGA